MKTFIPACFSTILCVFLSMFGTSVRSADIVQLDHSAGVPQILVDGTPVRAHMLYANPGFRNLILEPEGRVFSFDFLPENDEDAVGMQIRFGMMEGNFVLDDLQLLEVETGRELIPKITFDKDGIDDLKAVPLYLRPWELYGTSGEWSIAAGEGAEGSNALKITIKKPEDEKWPFFHLGSNHVFAMKKDKTYRMSFFGKADRSRPISIPFLVRGKQFSRIDGYGSILRREVELAAGAGINFVQTEIELPWPKPGEMPNWEDTDYIFETIIKANPNALVVPRIYIEAPEWWMKENPDDVMTGDKPFPKHYEVPGKISWITNYGASVVSTKYQAEVCKNLKILIEYLEGKFGANIGGYYPAGQTTNEWFYKGMWPGVLNGYAPADLEAWRRWLYKRYPDDKALQDAWGMPDVTRTGAAVPTSEERRANPGGQFHDSRFNPKASMLIDYNQYQQEVLVDCIITFCETVREASKGKRLILVCYGYFFELGAVPAGPGTSGHFALRRLLASKAIDIVGSPFSYHDRRPGDPGPMMSVVDSINLAGKLWFNEDDTRTHLVTQQNFPGSDSGSDTLEGTIQLLRRNTVQSILRYCGSWWTDLPSTGWFDDPQLWAEMKELGGIGFDLLNNPRPYRPEIGAYMDEASMWAVAAGAHHVNWHAIRAVRTPLGKVGAPYGQYLVDDLLAGKTATKLNVMLTTWFLTAEQRTDLKQAVRGKTNLWCYAPGYLDGRNGSSLEAMTDLTGLTYKKVGGTVAVAKPTPLGESLGLTQTFGLNVLNVNPLLAVVDAKPEEILATYPDGSAAIVLRKESDGTKTLFCGAPGLSTELLRLAAGEAGVHLYTDTDCVVYANGPYAYFYGVEDGTVEVDLKESGMIIDRQSGEMIGAGPKAKLSLKKGEGRILTIPPVKKENVAAGQTNKKKPNIILMLTDDIGWGDFKCYNPQGKIETPELDKLAAAGIRFTAAHSPAALCAPTRYSILTGNYPWRGRYPEGTWGWYGETQFLPGQKTFGHLLQEAGYRTAMFGKANVGAVYERMLEPDKPDFTSPLSDGPIQWGFDYSYILPRGHQHCAYIYYENNQLVGDPANIVELTTGPYNGGEIGGPGPGMSDWDSIDVGRHLTEKAVAFIDDHLARNKSEGVDRPFVIHFNTPGAHSPYTPPKELFGRPLEGVTKMTAKTDMVVEVDIILGHFVKVLKERNLYADTMLIITSDNGGIPYERKEFGHDAVGGLKGEKATIWEGGHRVPLIVHWGDGSDASTIRPAVSDQVVGLHDLVPTFCELAGIEPGADQVLDGVSLVPILFGKQEEAVPIRKSLFVQSRPGFDAFTEKRPTDIPFAHYVIRRTREAQRAGFDGIGYAVISDGWKLVFDLYEKPEFLIHLANDFTESNNLIAVPEHKERLEELQQIFRSIRSSERSTQPLEIR